MTAALVLWLGLFLPALADDEERPDSCEPLDASRFRDLLLQLQAGIDRGNLELSEQVIATMRHELPCLDFAPRSRQWAAYLVGEAVVRFAKGEDWEPAMATALRIYPNVDRGVSSRHPLASWEPPAPLSQGPRVPSMVTVYVDGMRAEQLPPSGELHLVQRTDGRFWNTWLAEPDTPVPLDATDPAFIQQAHDELAKASQALVHQLIQPVSCSGSAQKVIGSRLPR